MKENKAVVEYWLKYYVNKGLCCLCGNVGMIDTRGRAISFAEVDAGKVTYCICPNGQKRREFDPEEKTITEILKLTTESK